MTEEQTQSYNEGLEKARRLISKYIGKCLILPRIPGYAIIDTLNELDEDLMNLINEQH